MNIQVIKEEAEYEGLRFIFWAALGKIRSRMQIDIGFGDAIPAGYKERSLTTILTDLDSSIPKILIYPLESVMAEKFQAIVYLGEINSRMKDFYDFLFLANNNSFLLDNVGVAFNATFEKRKTDIGNRMFI